MRLDAHQHFWQYSPEEYPWIQPNWDLRNDYLPLDLEPLLADVSIDGSIAVQARQSLQESRWLLRLSDEHPRIRGVVGWVDLRATDVDDQLALLAPHPKFLGVRHVVQDEPDDRFLLRPDFLRGLSRLCAFDLTYDLLVFPRQLAAAIEVVERLPDQLFVLDHLAKPPIREGALLPWRELVQQLAQSPNVFCKVSGMVTEADWGRWRSDDFKPYLDTVFEAFGTRRLMFGSDWPVCLLAGSYHAVYKLVDEYLQQFPVPEQELVMGGNARTFYGVPDGSSADDRPHPHTRSA